MVNSTNIIAALAGTYTLLNTSSTLDGVAIPDQAYGENPVGILTYSRSGYMSANIAATEEELRPQNLTFPFTADQAESDWALVGKHGVSYAGPFSISDAIPATTTQGQVFHGPLTVANVPRWVGTRQPRNYTVFEDGRLLLIQSQRDGGYRGELWWERLD